jgi:hypothetical protein
MASDPGFHSFGNNSNNIVFALTIAFPQGAQCVESSVAGFSGLTRLVLSKFRRKFQNFQNAAPCKQQMERSRDRLAPSSLDRSWRGREKYLAGGLKK